ncbi:MAG: hypothetical protein IJX89_03170 [Alphaproteobacteria bacterium]|nr:hypothetical protein [Alphaproteobacteria bacterium]
MKRTLIRMLGAILSIFVSGRADALTYSYQTACPTCYLFGNAICGTGITEAGGYSSNAATGLTSSFCIVDSNDGNPRFVDSNRDCYNLLKSWGMCTTKNSEGYYALQHSGLDCVNASELAGYVLEAGESGNASTYYYSGSKSGYAEFRLQSGYSAYQYLCCIESGLTVGSGMCCQSSATCLDDVVYGGSCRDSSGFSAVEIVETGVGVGPCTDYFQDYFSSNQSTGFCNAYGDIFVEGTGALFIAEACYGVRAIDTGYYAYAQCGVVITSCKSENGYYSTNKEPSPLTFVSDGDSAYCKACPSVSGYDSGHDFSVKSNTGGTSITSCYATAGTPTITVSDTFGSYQETIDGSCPYSE